MRLASLAAVVLIAGVPSVSARNASSDSLFTPDPADGGRDQQGLLDRLEWLRDHPYDLNAITREELENLPGLTPDQATRVLALRTRLGRFPSVDHLRAIGDEGDRILASLRPFVVVTGTRERAVSPAVEWRVRVSRDLESLRGSAAGLYRGSPEAVYSRITITPSGRWQGGMTAEKDGGEEWKNGLRSGYVAGSGLPGGVNLIIGDYTVEAGQGLVLWRAAAVDRGGEVIGVVRRSGLGARPHRSTDESEFLRGVALSFTENEGPSAGLYVSSRRRAATLSGSGGVATISPSGLFRTDSEIRRYAILAEQVIGGRVSWRGRNRWSAGATAYDARLTPSVDEGRTFVFSGDRCTVVGIDAGIASGVLSLSGELARSRNGGMAVLAAAILEVGVRTKASVLFRNYGASYQSIHSSGFGQGDETRNEQGFYVGIETAPVRAWKVAGFVDIYRRPWATASLPFPSRGQELLLQIDGRVRRGLSLSIRGLARTSEGLGPASGSGSSRARVQMDRVQHGCRLTVEYEPGPLIRLRGRMEWTEVRYPLVFLSEHGYLVYEDVRLTPAEGLSIEGRIVLFHTASYDSRVYAYEGDLRGVYANSPLYGDGMRWYLLLRYQPASWLALSAKAGETRREGGASGEVEPAERAGIQLDLRL